MDTTINAPIQEVRSYLNRSANQKRSSDTVTSAQKAGENPSEMRGKEGDAGSENVDTVDITTRMMSESNQAAAKNEIEDIDAAAGKLQEIKQWLESEYESANIEQVHQVNISNLVEVLS
jgi:hypothetical protein